MLIYRNQAGFDRWGHFCFETEGGGGDSQSSGGLTDEALKAFNKRLEKMDGNSAGMAMVLFGENYQLREKLRVAEGKVSPEGATILTGDEAKDWQEYRTLGSVADVKQGLEQRTQLQTQVEESQRESTLRTVAETVGYKPTVLMQLDRMAKAQGKALAFEVRDVQQDGKTVRTPFVKDGESEHSLSDYAAANWGDFLPALTAQSQGQGGNNSGTRFPNQGTGSGSGAQGAQDLVATFQQEQNDKSKAVKNPLLRN